MTDTFHGSNPETEHWCYICSRPTTNAPVAVIDRARALLAKVKP